MIKILLGETRNRVLTQFTKIARETLAETRAEFRGLNRYVPNSANYNLIAYDTMNRGADMVGLYTLLGEPSLVSIFEEMFDICVDGKTAEFAHFREIDIHHS
jgi:hypothetical protein